MPVRGIRGAQVAAIDQPEAICSATQELLQEIMAANPGLRTEDMAGVVFTVTRDLTSAYPAQAARQIGWEQVPLMCAQEIPVPGGVPRCIRVLIWWNTELAQSEIHHVYLGEATRLRPDLCC